MVPLLFKKTLTTTEAQNEIIGGLVESLGCSVTEERNGIYELELKYPSNGSLLSELKIGNYILAKVRTQMSYNKQEFRIYEVTKPINGVVTVRCEHTSYLLNTYPVWKLEKGGYNVGTVMDYIFNSAHYYRPSDKPFLFSSPISERWVWKTPFELNTTNIRSAIGEVLNFFGGEIEFDNYQTKLHRNRGIERSLVIEYGINMTEFTCTEKLENYYTHFIPYVTYGDESPRFMSGDKKVMVLENPLNTEPRVLLQDITSLFTIDSPEQFSTLTDEEIQSSAEVFLENNKINEPSLNIDVSFVKINSTKISQEERDILEGLEDVNLCDTITIRHVPYGLEVKGKIIKTVFDVLRERYISLEIGTSKEDMGTVGKNALAGVTGYVNSIVNGQSEAADVINQRVREDLERLGKDISASYGGYISFTTDANKNYTQMIISDRVNGTRDPRAEGATGWIFSQNGLAHGTFDKDGNLTNTKVAINRDGTLAGENLVGYHVTASDITAGIISSPITEGDYAFFDVSRGILASHKTAGYNSYETQLNGSQLKQLFNGSVRGGTGMTSDGGPFLVYVRSKTDGYGIASVENDGDTNLENIALFSDEGIDFYKNVDFYGDVDCEKAIIRKNVDIYQSATIYGNTTIYGQLSLSGSLDMSNAELYCSILHMGDGHMRFSRGSDDYIEIWFPNGKGIYINDSGYVGRF